jgi:hypothetical protein
MSCAGTVLSQEGLTQRDRREGQRQGTGGEHAAPHRLDELAYRAVAIVELGGARHDADDRPLEHGVRQARRAGEGAAQIEREVGVAVLCEAAAQALWPIGHEPLPPSAAAATSRRGDAPRD